MCDLNNPDCFNCPYSDCTATTKDILRQWRYNRKSKQADNPDRIRKVSRSSVVPIRIYKKREGQDG